MFPDPSHPTGLATPHDSARTAIEALGLSDVNPGDLTGVAVLQPLVAAAVAAADNAAGQQAEAIRRETAARIQEWTARPLEAKHMLRGVNRPRNGKSSVGQVADLYSHRCDSAW